MCYIDGLRFAFSLAAVLGLTFHPAQSSAEPGQPIDVKVGHSEVMRPEQPAETVIIGNDQIANATIAARNTVVITGNAIGSTNLILLDEEGSELFSSTVRVVPVDPRPQRAIRVITGGANEGTSVYVCGPEPGCSPASDAAADATNAGTFGPCMHPGDIAADGSRCGDRAASVRPGGVDGEGQPEDSPADGQPK